jgi:hypothetical protein
MLRVDGSLCDTVSSRDAMFKSLEPEYDGKRIIRRLFPTVYGL